MRRLNVVTVPQCLRCALRTWSRCWRLEPANCHGAWVYERHAALETNQDRLAEHVEVSQLEVLDLLSSDQQVVAVLQADNDIEEKWSES